MPIGRIYRLGGPNRQVQVQVDHDLLALFSGSLVCLLSLPALSASAPYPWDLLVLLLETQVVAVTVRRA
jgi:hypothetical protein